MLVEHSIMVQKSFTEVSDYGLFGTVSKTLFVCFFFHFIQVSLLSLSLSLFHLYCEVLTLPVNIMLC